MGACCGGDGKRGVFSWDRLLMIESDAVSL